MQSVFEEGVLYRAGDDRLKRIAKDQTWAKWRHLGCGPSYLKIGGRVFYEGGTLARWIDAQRVNIKVAVSE